MSLNANQKHPHYLQQVNHVTGVFQWLYDGADDKIASNINYSGAKDPKVNLPTTDLVVEPREFTSDKDALLTKIKSQEPLELTFEVPISDQGAWVAIKMGSINFSVPPIGELTSNDTNHRITKEELAESYARVTGIYPPAEAPIQLRYADGFGVDMIDTIQVVAHFSDGTDAAVDEITGDHIRLMVEAESDPAVKAELWKYLGSYADDFSGVESAARAGYGAHTAIPIKIPLRFLPMLSDVTMLDPSIASLVIKIRICNIFDPKLLRVWTLGCPYHHMTQLYIQHPENISEHGYYASEVAGTPASSEEGAFKTAVRKSLTSEANGSSWAADLKAYTQIAASLDKLTFDPSVDALKKELLETTSVLPLNIMDTTDAVSKDLYSSSLYAGLALYKSFMAAHAAQTATKDSLDNLSSEIVTDIFTTGDWIDPFQSAIVVGTRSVTFEYEASEDATAADIAPYLTYNPSTDRWSKRNNTDNPVDSTDSKTYEFYGVSETNNTIKWFGFKTLSDVQDASGCDFYVATDYYTSPPDENQVFTTVGASGGYTMDVVMPRGYYYPSPYPNGTSTKSATAIIQSAVNSITNKIIALSKPQNGSWTTSSAPITDSTSSYPMLGGIQASKASEAVQNHPQFQKRGEYFWYYPTIEQFTSYTTQLKPEWIESCAPSFLGVADCFMRDVFITSAKLPVEWASQKLYTTCSSVSPSLVTNMVQNSNIIYAYFARSLNMTNYGNGQNNTSLFDETQYIWPLARSTVTAKYGDAWSANMTLTCYHAPTPEARMQYDKIGQLFWKQDKTLQHIDTVKPPEKPPNLFVSPNNQVSTYVEKYFSMRTSSSANFHRSDSHYAPKQKDSQQALICGTPLGLTKASEEGIKSALKTYVGPMDHMDWFKVKMLMNASNTHAATQQKYYEMGLGSFHTRLTLMLANISQLRTEEMLFSDGVSTFAGRIWTAPPLEEVSFHDDDLLHGATSDQQFSDDSYRDGAARTVTMTGREANKSFNALQAIRFTTTGNGKFDSNRGSGITIDDVLFPAPTIAGNNQSEALWNWNVGRFKAFFGQHDFTHVISRKMMEMSQTLGGFNPSDDSAKYLGAAKMLANQLDGYTYHPCDSHVFTTHMPAVGSDLAKEVVSGVHSDAEEIASYMYEFRFNDKVPVSQVEYIAPPRFVPFGPQGHSSIENGMKRLTSDIELFSRRLTTRETMSVTQLAVKLEH